MLVDYITQSYSNIINMGPTQTLPTHLQRAPPTDPYQGPHNRKRHRNTTPHQHHTQSLKSQHMTVHKRQKNRQKKSKREDNVARRDNVSHESREIIRIPLIELYSHGTVGIYTPREHEGGGVYQIASTGSEVGVGSSPGTENTI